MDERIVMTPRGKTATSTSILIERQKILAGEQHGKNLHVAQGQHSGIIINKVMSNDVACSPAHLQLEFKVFLIEASTQKHIKESRQLQFHFSPLLLEKEYARTAQEFFKELVSPLEFPRDYVGFIKKIMKMMQHKYTYISKIEIDLRQLDDTDRPLKSSKSRVLLYTVGKAEPDPVAEDEGLITEEKVLGVIEVSYPNPITEDSIASQLSTTTEVVNEMTTSLCNKGTIKLMAPGCYARVVQNETDVQIVRQMPTIASNKQPTIAIITAHFCEKVAVDSMIENQETFVRYTTVGENNVYTLGNIGFHRVVSTKLPQVGHDRSALIAAGNTTTRLLGTFQKVDHVFLVGVAGGVPHFTDYMKHVRLGDLVISVPTNDTKCIYVYCDEVKNSEGSVEYETKSWCPANMALQEIAMKLKDQGDNADAVRPWLTYLETSQQKLQSQEIDYKRPEDSTDKLYMSIGGSDVIEVSHPVAPEAMVDARLNGTPRIHLGCVGSGRAIGLDDQLRQDFALHSQVLAYDQEFDSVMDSVCGNRKDHYIVIRGISDYKDGTKNKEWQPYASLVAASFMKAIICAMELPPED